MPMNYESPVRQSDLTEYSKAFRDHSAVDPSDYVRYNIKRGLRNSDGTGIMVGLTHVCTVEGYYIDDGERIPKHGRLIYRGYDIKDLVDGFWSEDRFGFEETAFLLLFGFLPTAEQLRGFRDVIAECRELPDEFIEDVIMKAPSPSVINKMASSVLNLYSYDEDPDDVNIENVMRQSIQLISQMPAIMAYAYQVKRRHYYKKSMYIHPQKFEYSTAQTILNSIRADKQFTDEEAKLLDLMLVLHADHGGGNNSTFSTRVLTSTLTDTYSAITAGIGALKGPRHGGANIKVAQMTEAIKNTVEDYGDPEQVREYLKKVILREAGDGTGLIYGMGHAVYTLSDPREVLLKQCAKKMAEEKGFGEDFRLLEIIEEQTPSVFAEVKGVSKRMCGNVDLYSGLIYKMLRIPEDLYTPLFVCARTVGWCAHRMEELYIGRKIFRPAYKGVTMYQKYIPFAERKNDLSALNAGRYVPVEDR